jgi:hypothetical protein
MHWVVCKTQRVKEIERDFRESLREESEQLGGHISQDKVGTNPKEIFLCECCPYFLLLGRTVRIRTVRTTRRGHDFRGCPLARKSRQIFLEVFLLLLGRTVQVVQHSVGHVFLGTNFEEVVQLYGFGHVFQGKNFVGQICCCEVFFLAGNCEFAVVMYFPEAI